LELTPKAANRSSKEPDTRGIPFSQGKDLKAFEERRVSEEHAYLPTGAGKGIGEVTLVELLAIGAIVAFVVEVLAIGVIDAFVFDD
jgi:hypothetical protein